MARKYATEKKTRKRSQTQQIASKFIFVQGGQGEGAGALICTRFAAQRGT